MSTQEEFLKVLNILSATASELEWKLKETGSLTAQEIGDLDEALEAVADCRTAFCQEGGLSVMDVFLACRVSAAMDAARGK